MRLCACVCVLGANARECVSRRRGVSRWLYQQNCECCAGRM